MDQTGRWKVKVAQLSIYEIDYRAAEISDLPAIREFVDFWITGGGLRFGVEGASHDCFIPPGRHEKYVKQYSTIVAMHAWRVVGWAVKQKDGTLIHLLVAGDYRGQGIGDRLLAILDPPKVRSKFDQGTGDPIGFYERRGYVKQGERRVGKHQNIDILVKDEADAGV